MTLNVSTDSPGVSPGMRGEKRRRLFIDVTPCQATVQDRKKQKGGEWYVTDIRPTSRYSGDKTDTLRWKPVFARKPTSGHLGPHIHTRMGDNLRDPLAKSSTIAIGDFPRAETASLYLTAKPGSMPEEGKRRGWFEENAFLKAEGASSKLESSKHQDKSRSGTSKMAAYFTVSKATGYLIGPYDTELHRVNGLLIFMCLSHRANESQKEAIHG